MKALNRDPLNCYIVKSPQNFRAFSDSTILRFNDSTRKAFTLIELILVLALLVIITSIAVPTMSRFIRGRALGSESTRMLALMHAAQSRAVSEGMPMMFWIDVQKNGYGVAAETSGKDGDAKAEDLLADDTLKIAVVNAGAGTTATTFKICRR